MSEDYRVELDIYNGPIDLLLYLIRKEEVDIYDIPIARIADQYLEHVEVIHQFDPNLAGEFLVMATMLMEIKSRMLLPVQTEETEEGGSIDPRSELVRQLLEYKRFKDAASWLSDAADNQSRKFPRVPVLPQINQGEVDMEDIHIWDLVEAFSKLLQATLASVGLHEVEKDDTPLALHQADILDRLEREGPMPFSRIFQGKTRRTEIIGLFLAMLELIRQKKIRIEQDKPFAEIYLFLKVDLPEAEQENGPETAEPDQPQQRQEARAESEPGPIAGDESAEAADSEHSEASEFSEPLTDESPDDILDDEDEDNFHEIDKLDIDSKLWDNPEP